MRRAGSRVALAAAAPRRTYASSSSALSRHAAPLQPIAFTSYFQEPDLGVFEAEMLSRASLTLVRVPTQQRRQQQQQQDSAHNESLSHSSVVALAPAHVSHPWLYRETMYTGEQYDWLKYLREASMQTRLGIRTGSKGTLRAECRLGPGGIRSSTFDAVVQRLSPETLHLASLVPFQLDSTASSTSTPSPPTHTSENNPVALPVFELSDDMVDGEEVIILGHALRQAEHHDDETMIPCTIRGTITQLDSERGLIKTEVLAEMGLCGGPVVSMRTGHCLGTVEALIIGSIHEHLRERTVFLRSRVLQPLVSASVRGSGWQVLQQSGRPFFELLE